MIYESRAQPQRRPPEAPESQQSLAHAEIGEFKSFSVVTARRTRPRGAFRFGDMLPPLFPRVWEMLFVHGSSCA